ncbi:MAG: hypothetical protein U1A77_19835 [Pirellulales bacterium]
MSKAEQIPTEEARQIQHIVELTIRQLQMRYPDKRVLRGVHTKDHGCVEARFEIEPEIDADLRVGVFQQPCRCYRALVRFSNADTLVRPDSTPGANGGPPAHGSRGMAIKLLDAPGPFLETGAEPSQDFLMINQPVFAFANVEDYEVLSRVVVDHKDDIRPFFAERLPPPGTDTPSPSQLRARKTGEIAARIRSNSATDVNVPAFQPPPASPVDNSYFGASSFQFGPDRVMRFRAVPAAPSSDVPDVSDPNYLRTGLARRLRDQKQGPVVFHFEVRVRNVDSLNPAVDIENASMDWTDSSTFRRVATLTIPLQEFDTPELRERCEQLVFTPWHGLVDHRPLGGINRLRRAVYEASARFRNLPKFA